MKTNHLLLLIFIISILFIKLQNHDNISNNYYQVIDYSSDDSYSSDDPYEEPTRHYVSKYTQRVPINIPTRGHPPEYQSMGILTDPTNSENIKPLYGRQTYPGSNKYNYFTKKDSHLAPSIPLSFENKDCTKENGCKELDNNSQISLNNVDYNINLYEHETIRYLPY